MTRLSKLLAAVCLAASLATPLAHAAATDAPPYDERANARNEISQAVTRAQAEHKKVLLVFGANWCPDCRSLAAQMKEGELADKTSQRFVVVKVNVGNWDRNMDLAKQYGNVTQKGIPAAAVLDAEGKLQTATLAGELESARSMNADAVLAVLDSLEKKN